MAGKIEAFYDDFSQRFIEDLVEGNERIDQQLDFFARAISSRAKAVLVIGCGSGQGVHFIASNVAKNAKLLAVDISRENLRLARTLFSHPRIEYRKADITVDRIEGVWDIIVLPDVYEHIPKESRQNLHAAFNELLSSTGRVLVTVPSPGKQASLYARGEGLQIVDEVVTLEDLNSMAAEVGGALTYFNMISVWETNDYIHAVIERQALPVRAISELDMVLIKGWRHRTFFYRGLSFMVNRLHLSQVLRARRRRRLKNQLERISQF